jgi:hypothetical protein
MTKKSPASFQNLHVAGPLRMLCSLFSACHDRGLPGMGNHGMLEPLQGISLSCSDVKKLTRKRGIFDMEPNDYLAQNTSRKEIVPFPVEKVDDTFTFWIAYLVNALPSERILPSNVSICPPT